MKKFSFILIMLFILTGCNNKKTVDLKSDISVDMDRYNDCTATIENYFEISEEAMYSSVWRESCFSYIYTNVADLYPDSENIVVGTVVDTIYSDENAMAATYCTFAVEEVLKGSEIEANSLITIAAFQGFCRISKYAEVYGNDHFLDFDMSKGDTTYFVYTFDGEPLIQNGDNFVLFLSPKQENETIDGIYFVPIGMYMGRYKMNDEGLYERYSPQDEFYAITNERTRSVEMEQPMTLQELREVICEVKTNVGE